MDSEFNDREAIVASRARLFRTAGRIRPPRLHGAQRNGDGDRRALADRSIRCSPRRPPMRSSVKLDPNLDVVKKTKGPVMTLVDEFYKVGPGPSSSHTIGPMRITYDFYQRAIKLPQATARPGDGAQGQSVRQPQRDRQGPWHRARGARRPHRPRAGDDRSGCGSRQDAAEPDKVYPVKLGTKTINASLKDIIYDATKGDFPHANTMTAKLMAGDKVLLEQEYYSVGGGFIEWKGYTPPKKNPPKYPYRTMAEVLAYTQARQYLDRPARHGQRDVDFGPERGGDQRLPRQDHRRDARDGEDRPRGADVDLARADQAQDQGGRRLQERA